MRLFAEFFLQLFGHANPTSDHHHIDVFRGSFKENVAHITAHDITFHTEFVGAVANQVKNRLIEQFGKFLVAIKSHRLSVFDGKVTKNFHSMTKKMLFLLFYLQIPLPLQA